MLLGCFIGYLGSFDSKNFFILGVPAFLLLRSTEFNCYTDKIRYERQKNIQIALTTFRDVLDFARTFNPDNMQEMKEKVQNILRNMMGGIDLQSLVSTGMSSLLMSHFTS
jgi:hypothetical protein